MPQDDLKHAAALRATEYVRDNMVVGLGTGSTAKHAIYELGRRVKEEELRIKGVPTSDRTADLAREAGIPLAALEDVPHIDVTIDGADEIVLTSLDAIKGLGGALLREKLVALVTRLQILIVDESKVVTHLGDHTAVPVEVVQFGWTHTRHKLAALGCQPIMRRSENGDPFTTDSGNLLLDCRFPIISDPHSLADAIKCISGVVEHGLFLGIAHRAIIASASGVREATR